MHSVCPSLWKGSKCEGSRKIVFGDTKTGPFVYSVSSGPVSLQILWSLYTWVNSDIEGPLKKNKGEKDCKCCCVSVNNVPRCMCVVSSCYHSHKAEVVTWITVWTRINFFFHSAREIYSYLCHFPFIVWLLRVLNRYIWTNVMVDIYIGAGRYSVWLIFTWRKSELFTSF